LLNRTEPAERLIEITGFGTNPGNLKAYLHMPPELQPGAPLVVALHGCTQEVADFANGTGWSALGDRHGFAVLYPAQQRSNNQHLCFNWFEPDDIRRDAGEAASIRQMADHVVDAFGLDPDRVFAVGLSAGGAMANALLALYPERFAAGAVIAALPFGTAIGVSQAFLRMQDRHQPAMGELRRMIRRASPRTRKWPRLSIWQGSHDHTVRPNNADLIVEQWRDPLGVGETPDRTETIGGHVHTVWLDKKGGVAIEQYRVRTSGHGVPLSTDGAEPVGRIGPFMLETGISSTMRIARFFGLVDEKDVLAAEGELARREEKPRAPAKPKPRKPATKSRATERKITRIINGALKAAGLIH
jgi:poly(hydroxyalkanoate) depolymerase family esterase